MNKARRYNKDKLRYDLLPKHAIERVVEVYTKGADKYTLRDEEGNIISDGSNNWKSGLSWMSMVASAKRHIEAFIDGEDYDPELKTLHLSNACWNLLGILEYYKIHPEMDDRDIWYKKSFKRVYMDIDNVLSSLDQYFLGYMGYPMHHATDWNDWRYLEGIPKLMEDKDFWLNMPVLTKPEVITYPISGYCTARSIPLEWTEEWLLVNNFPKANIISVGYEKSKYEALKDVCDVMIDDNIHNFVELNSKGLLCYLYTQPHNEKYEVGHMRVNSIEEFIQKIK